MSTQLGQAAPQLWLKNDDQRDGEKDRETAHDPTNHDKVKQLRNQGQRQKNNRQPGQNLGAARSAKIKVAIINPDTEQDDLEDAAPALQPKMQNFFNHCSTASATPKAPIFSLTSCTRMMFAPRERSNEVNATVGASRSLMSDEPTSLPRNAFRETPTTSGRSCTRRAPSLPMSSRLCSSVLPKPIPGSNAIAMGSMPHSRARACCCKKKSATSETRST